MPKYQIEERRQVDSLVRYGATYVHLDCGLIIKVHNLCWQLRYLHASTIQADGREIRNRQDSVQRLISLFSVVPF